MLKIILLFQLSKIQLWDSVGGEHCGFETEAESRDLRRHYYSKAYLVLLCYSTDDIESFQRIQKYQENVKFEEKLEKGE